MKKDQNDSPEESGGFSDFEKAAMQERAAELKTQSKRGIENSQRRP